MALELRSAGEGGSHEEHPGGGGHLRKPPLPCPGPSCLVYPTATWP